MIKFCNFHIVNKYKPASSIENILSNIKIEHWYDENGRWHRDFDFPAYINSSGISEYFKHGLRHRNGDLPSRIQSDGRFEYHKNGCPHRVNPATGEMDVNYPAIILEDGKKLYYKNGDFIRFFK